MGRRQGSSRDSWQSNDWSRNSPRDWNDGGIGGGDDRSRYMSGEDDRWESGSGNWETDQGRASYDYDPSRNFGSSGPYGRDESYGRGDYGRGFGGRGDYRTQTGSQDEWQRGEFGHGGYGRGQFGQGDYGRGSGQAQFGQGNYGQGNYRQGHSGGQSGHGDYSRQPEHGQGGMQNRGFGEGMSRGGHSGRGPKGYRRSDDRIREDVSDSLTDDPDVDASEITVEARDGEVTLTGTVQTREEKRAAESCAEEVSGVREVINQLRVSRGSSSESSMGASGASGRSQSGQSGKGGRSSSES